MGFLGAFVIRWDGKDEPMTQPDDTERDDLNDGTGVTGALGAASQEQDEAADPLAPLDQLADDDDKT